MLDVRVLAAADPGAPREDGTFSLGRQLGPKALDGPLFYLRLPGRVARELRAAPVDVVVAQSPYEGLAVALGRMLARRRPKLIVEVHGDWRTFTRLYGSRWRRALTYAADRLAARMVRRADAVRAVSPYTARLVRELGREPEAEFAAFMDLEAFLLRPPVPLPERPQALFVGVLERYKNLDGLLQAWRRVAPEVPAARLELVGEGTLRPLVEELLAEEPGRVRWTPRLPTSGIVEALDRSSFLVLPSRSEGMGRVIVEAFCRGRPVLGAHVGGIPDLVRDGESGLLFDPSPEAIAAALRRALTEPELIGRLAAGARASVEPLLVAPEEFARELRAFVDRVCER